jgi:hypothetical protein
MKKTTVAVSLLVFSLAVALAFVVACGDSMPKPPSAPDPAAAAKDANPMGSSSAAPATSSSAAPAKK